MAKREIPILGPSYADPNLHWSRQVTMNWLPVRAEASGALTQWQLRDAPGVKPFVRITREVEIPGDPPTFATIDVGGVRGMHNVEGKLFVVAAQTLYQISNTGVAIPFGTIPGVGRVSMDHNQRGLGSELCIDNGSARYVFNTNTNILTKVTDEGFPGSFMAFFVDGYMGFIEPQGRFWGHSELADALNYNTLDRYEAEGDPDRIVSGIVSHREALIFGKDTIEPYVNTGGQTGTFERASNTVIEVGCAARFTPRHRENSVCWLDDKRIVRRMDGYTPVRISTDAVEAAFQECSEAEILQAYAFTWESRGHKVYYITVPGRFTFGHDELTGQWHQRSTWNMPHWDVVDAVLWNGRWIVGSAQNGRLYELDFDYKLDRCDPLLRQRTTGKLWDAENEITLNNVELKFQTGGPVSVCVPFPGQPEGPSLSGEAPDALTGDPYSFAYTATPGDAPISRTVLMPGSYVLIDGEQKSIPSNGWAWNQATATISHPATPVPVTTVHLNLRTYDTNGLYADHTDEFMVVQEYYFLLTGNPISGGGPLISTARALEPLDFDPIPQSSGANLQAGVPAKVDDWVYATSASVRHAANLAGPWTTGTISSGSAILYMVGLENGLMANEGAGGGSPTGYTTSADDDFVFTAPSFTGQFSNGTDASAQLAEATAAFSAGGLYLRNDVGSRALLYSDSPNGPYSAAWDQSKITNAGQNPNGACILQWLDVKKWKGAWYATVLWDFNIGSRRVQLLRSNTLDDWSAPEILIDVVPATDPNISPGFISPGDEFLVVKADGPNVWTSANDFAAPIALPILATHDIAASSKKIANASHMHMVIGTGANTGDVTVSTDGGLTWGAALATGITALNGIVCDYQHPEEEDA